MLYNRIDKKLQQQGDYTTMSRNFQLVLPMNYEIMIEEDDSVRLLDDILENLDYSQLYKTYQRSNSAISPVTMFKITVYGYMNGLYSSREIEEACKRDVNFMWLLEGQKAPDHNTINRFRQRIVDETEGLFSQLVKKLADVKEIAYENIFIDGTKLEANANKYTFVWKKTTEKSEAKLKDKTEQVLSELKDRYNMKFTDLAEAYRYFVKLDIELVSGKGKHKTQKQRDYELINELLSKQNKYDNYNDLFNGRNSFSKTDTDATFMHMKEDHMRNSQLKPGYNIQIGVENEYIVGVDVSSERTDQRTLVPFLKKLERNLSQKYTNIIADAGYESEENYVFLEENKQVPYIKPQTYEQWKKRSFKNLIGKRENMIYNEEVDEYICHNNKRLIKTVVSKRKNASGYISEITNYECENCEGCSFKTKCTKAKGNRTLTVSKKFIEKRNISFQNITTEKGKQLRMNRSIQVEGAFGVIKQDYGFNRFLTRGTKNVRTEFLILVFAFNIKKYHNRIQAKRTGFSLYELNSA